MMLLTALDYTIAFVLLTTVTVFMSAKIESKITFKEILDGFKRRWDLIQGSLSFILLKNIIRKKYILYNEKL